MTELQSLTGLRTVWQALRQTDKPIVLYGMGNGAQGILEVCAENGIPIAGVFASDEFVRGHSFAGFAVQRLSQIEERYGSEFVIVVGFAVHDERMLRRLTELDRRYELYAPDIPVAGGGLFDEQYYAAHEPQFIKACSLLEDECSRQVFWDVLRYKLTGKIHWLNRCTTPKQEAYTTLLRPHEAEHYVDLGAYDGDTIRELLAYTEGRFAHITALEPDEKNYRKLMAKLRESLLTEALDRVDAYRLLAHSTQAVLRFSAQAGRNSALGPNSNQKTREQAADSVDRLLGGCEVPPTLIKLDVEGAEHDALLGCAGVIGRYAPRLVVSVYHRKEDLYDLLLLVKRLNPAYRLYLRKHPYIPAWDVNLYAVP